MCLVNLNVKFVLAVFLLDNVNSFAIPSYHKTCKFSDTDFEKCAVSVANTILDNYRKGDTILIDPSLKLIKLPFITLGDNADTHLNISDVTILGYGDIKILKIKKVPGENRLEVNAFAEEIKVSGDYSLDVVLNGKRIAGKGKGSITYFGDHFKCNFEWKLIDKNGDKYLEVTKVEILVDLDNIVHKVDGVDNKSLDENWGELMAKVGPSVNPFFERVFHGLTDIIFKEIPYNKLFLD